MYLDFAKAFDSVVHAKLIHKLKSYGIAGRLLNWISAFLGCGGNSPRRQRVLINGSFSDFVIAISGVPQGSALGPTLFIVHINDYADRFCA